MHAVLLRLVLFPLFLLALAVGIAGQAPRNAPPAERAALENLLAGTGSLSAARSVDLARVRAFYELRNGETVWIGEGAPDARAALVLETLSRADEEGLEPARYHVPALTGASLDTPVARAEFELLMTDGLLRYARDMQLGLVVPERVERDIRLPAREFDAAAALQDALQADGLAGFLAGLAPPHPEYARLRDALARYRALAANGGWAPLPSGIDASPGSTDTRLSLLRRRLAVEDAALAPGGPDGASEDLLAALKRYQARNGLEPDGVIGPRTLGMLDISAEQRVQQIIANMERWRWLPRRFEDRYVMVNAADATLAAIADGAVALRSRVIVGQLRMRTPMLRAESVSVTVNPPWNVPRSIAVNEMLPRLREDPSYLEARNIVIVDGPANDPYGLAIDWNAVRPDAFPYRLQQAPGPQSALRFLKLEMPNPLTVFLHDTTTQAAFAREARTLSHGCVRVQQIVPLSSWALSGSPDAAVGRLNDAIGTGETQNIPFAAPLPVYVLYWTAATNAGGSFGFRPDTYRRDERLIAALNAV